MHKLNTKVVIVVEDADAQRDEVVLSLQLSGMSAFGAANAQTLDQLMQVHSADVVVLDIGLPGESGLQIAQRLAAMPTPVGVIMLTANGALDDRLLGMAKGADAYLVKPADPRELIATIEALRRRMALASTTENKGSTGQTAALQAAGWLLSHGGRQLSSAGAAQAIHLTELQRLLLLCFRGIPPGQPVSRENLMDALGYGGQYGDPHRLETLISRLRQKVRERLSEDLLLQAVPGQGYAMVSSLLVV